MRELMKRIWSWMRFDGMEHTVVSALLMVALGWIRPLWFGVLLVASIGIGKEIYDKVSGKGTPEWHDLICDGIGIVIGLLIVFLNIVRFF